MKLEKLRKKLVRLEENLWIKIEMDDDIKSDHPLYEASNLITQAYNIMQEYIKPL